jgi:cobalt-zinc-cadmium efflux system outer membrane protein
LVVSLCHPGSKNDWRNRILIMWKSATTLAAALAIGFVLTGCKGVATSEERFARNDAKMVGAVYRANGQRPQLPTLTAESDLKEFLRFAMLNHPQIEAAYYDWMASVERITVERSLPDPKLTFEMYIMDAITSLMPGLMMDIPGPGKLGARATVASAESHAKYFQFESSVLQTAFAVKKAYYPLHFLTEKIRVNRQTLALLADLEKLARSQNEVGKATLQDVLRAQIEQERLRNDIANLEDSRRLLMAQFKAALGLSAAEPDPPLPNKFESTMLNLSDQELFSTALAHNPRLKEMEAEVRLAEAGIQLARKDKVPDFSAGFKADVKASPVIWNPQFSMTLPIWRDKLAAELAAAQAGKRAAEARLTAEQIALAVDFAEKTYLVREAGRELSLLQERLLPRARQSLAVARGAYRSGQVDFLNVIDAERMLLGFQLDDVAAHTQQEVALAGLSLVIAGLPPSGAPLLNNQSAISKPTR